MVQLVVKPKEELEEKEVRTLNLQERSAYIQRYIMKILELNKQRGVTFTEFLQTIPYLDRNGLVKLLNVLLAKRQIYKVRRGKYTEYYPNNRPLHPLVNRTLTIGDRRYRLQLIDNPDALCIYLQELHKDLMGIEEVVGGIMIPFSAIDKMTSFLGGISKEKPKLIEELKEIKIKEYEQKIGGDTENE